MVVVNRAVQMPFVDQKFHGALDLVSTEFVAEIVHERLDVQTLHHKPQTIQGQFVSVR
jgi:hypothetical protein